MMLTFEEASRIFQYDEETGKLYWKERVHKRIRVGWECGRLTSHGYRKLRVYNIEYYTHRVVWLLKTGEWPKNQIDHINHTRDDNRFYNLRDVTCQQNVHNTSHVGVHKARHGTTYSSTIMVNGDRIYLGNFPSAEIAKQAYKTAKEKYHAVHV
jgi:hypothetical protein